MGNVTDVKCDLCGGMFDYNIPLCPHCRGRGKAGGRIGALVVNCQHCNRPFPPMLPGSKPPYCMTCRSNLDYLKCVGCLRELAVSDLDAQTGFCPHCASLGIHNCTACGAPFLPGLGTGSDTCAACCKRPGPKEAEPRAGTKVAFVTWTDSAFYAGELPASEAGRVSLMTSCGLLVRYDEEMLVLALDRDHDGDYRFLLTIPKGNVQTIKILDL